MSHRFVAGTTFNAHEVLPPELCAHIQAQIDAVAAQFEAAAEPAAPTAESRIAELERRIGALEAKGQQPMILAKDAPDG